MRVIKRFEGASINCYNLSLWKKIKFKKQENQQFVLKGITINIRKEKITGLYSNDATATKLLEFLSLKNP